MKIRSELAKILQHEDINFLLTNRIPRRLATRFLGWFSQIENPYVARASIAIWRLFADLDLSDAKAQTFKSLHACFTRELKPNARMVDADPGVLTSPCDGIVGACGSIDGTELLQAKGFPYSLKDLLHDPALVDACRDGQYVTLRLTSSMYHRFHAPHDGMVEHVTYISGDTWNVNPIALRRVAELFCKNERAVIRTSLRDSGHLVILVPVAAILVASIRLHVLDDTMNMNYRGAIEIDCDASFRKGEELGWFEHGSTIIVFAPRGFRLCDDIREGAVLQMGRALMHLP
ncbi:MAG: archaetidylserine decarboxylase [Reyranella sp.]|uniref:archaetidylserine decarboxylase n=1 Tax=Reyranella sp. TaxID=1929291 RepID=UPI0027313B05|nr:archaetidylserine decarboxylase [Reyranella sp.]MDP1962951.1 archaetidylserine decarboxylase [Reyranella sp.]MDP2375162.1 archaetidylserine decarboxylase [Reyranella sp.]